MRLTDRATGLDRLSYFSEHFSKGTELGVQLGKMEVVEVFVESGGGTGSIGFATARLVVD